VIPRLNRFAALDCQGGIISEMFCNFATVKKVQFSLDIN
jgi:hypothetical protein